MLDRDISLEDEKIKLDFVVVKNEGKENTNAEVDKKPKTSISQKCNSNLKNLCPQKDSSKCGLKMHVEATEREITCHLCPEKFTYECTLIRRIKFVHEHIKFQCHLYSKKFTEKSNLRWIVVHPL